jgi:putative ABC transport system ATP-binding protein
MSSPPRLELRQVSKTYRNGGQPLQVLHEVSLLAEAGVVTALVGRSGCGKTTLLNLAGVMDFPTSGEVLIDGRSTSSLSEAELTSLRRKRVGFVFQFFQLLPAMTVLENVELPLLLAGCGKRLLMSRLAGETACPTTRIPADADHRGTGIQPVGAFFRSLLARTRNGSAAETARERLRWVDLEDKASAYPHQLSGGQMQRAAIARALAHSPDVLIADEPTGNLDTASGDQVLALIRESAVRYGAAVLMATHSAEAASIAAVRVSLRDGRIQAIDRQ